MIIREERVEEILHRLASGNIYCFGAGDFGKKFLNDSDFENIRERVAAFVDNDRKKWGTCICISGKVYEIISPDNFIRKMQKNDIMIITCKNFMPILTQLNEAAAFNGVTCYVYTKLKEYLFDTETAEIFVPDNLMLTSEARIPKVIHYCWFGGNPIPEKCRQWMETWKKFCPDYEIVEWNESNYDVSKNVYMKQAYENKKWAFVSDYARLDIMYNHGGIYLDTDVELVRNMDELLFQNGFCGYQNSEEINMGLGYGAVKENVIIKKILERYEDLRFCREDGTWDLTPCPVIQSQVLKQEGAALDGSFQVLPDMTIYPERVLSGKSQKTRRIRVTDRTYAIHHFEASWMEGAEYRHRRVRDSLTADYERILTGGGNNEGD